MKTVRTLIFCSRVVWELAAITLWFLVLNHGCDKAFGQEPDVSEKVSELVKVLNDRDLHYGLRSSAGVALGELGPEAKAAVPALSEALKDREPNVRNSAGVALGQIGPAAVPALSEALKDANSADEYKRVEGLILAKLLLIESLGGIGPEAKAAAKKSAKDARGFHEGPKNNNYGTKLSAIKYAKMIEPELGVPPVVDCGAGVEIPIYVKGKKFKGDPGIHCCDNPSLQMGDCMSGSSLQRYEGKTADGKPLPHVVWVFFARHDGRDNVFKTDVGDSVQLIGYNTKTGATAFLESGDNRKWVRVDPKTNRLTGVLPGIDDPEGFNKAYVTPGRTQCVQCHQSDPFIHNPFLDAARLPSDPSQPVVPNVAGPDSPYYVIGASHWDMRTIHIEGNGCVECHRIGMKTVEEFVGDGWDPHKHMPPYDPGSLKEDFQELLAAWKNGPENTPGCDWIIPPAGDAPSRVVGADYPHKAGFNKPSFAALSRLHKEPVPIPEPTALAETDAKQEDRGTSRSFSGPQTTADRFREEIARRSPEENRHELESLKQSLKAEKERGNEDRVRVLSREIRLIEEALKGGPGANAGRPAERSPELHVLDHFGGTWDVEHTAKTSEGTIISRHKSISVRSWSRGGQFLRFEDNGDTETNTLITYDPLTRTYPGVLMQGPHRSNITGTWDATTRTMTFIITFEDGNKLKSTHRFVERNVAEVSGVITNPDGKIVAQLSFKLKRREERRTANEDPVIKQATERFREEIASRSPEENRRERERLEEYLREAKEREDQDRVRILSLEIRMIEEALEKRDDDNRTSDDRDSRSEAEKLERKYEQLLKDRPDIRRKLESGDATKEDIIVWMKKGGDRQKADSKPHNFPSTAFEYARMVEEELGVPPRIDLDRSIEIPIYVDGVQRYGNLGSSCDNPTRLGKDTISGSVLQRYEGRTADGEPLPDVVWVSFGRNSSSNHKHALGSVQMIGHNEKTGATAFFESSDKISPWVRLDKDTLRMRGVMPWIDKPEEFNRAFVPPGNTQCVACHQADPFITNTFINTAKIPGTDESVVPALGRESPYYVIGGENWDMRTIHIEGNSCFECHRVGMTTLTLFKSSGWDPNKHMPPYDPGSLTDDLSELLDAWKRGPENVQGAKWIIPPARGKDRQVVGADYPYKAPFNQPRSK